MSIQRTTTRASCSTPSGCASWPSRTSSRAWCSPWWSVRVRAAARVVQKQLSVRQTEALVRRERSSHGGPPAEPAKPAVSAGVRDLETRLERHFGTKVRLAQKSNQAGSLEIDYHSLDQLDGI